MTRPTPGASPPAIPGLTFREPLGVGGYADVHLYQQQSPQRSVAVKVLKGDGLTPELRRQFVAEADTMALFGNHPHIVQVFWADTAADGRPYLVMEYYPPPHLGERARQRPLSVQDVLRTGIQLAGAVETAHRGGVTHRDIKPANVLVDFYEQPALTDFGIAGRGGAELEHGDVGVSVPWAPPEVLTGESNGDVAGDVYSLCATLWHLLVGRSPFAVPGGDNTQTGLTTRIKRAEVPRTGRADVPVSLERLLARGMAKDRRLRPSSALALARDLVAVEQELRLPATAIRLPEGQGGGAPASAAPAADDRTRQRTPQRIEAQPVARAAAEAAASPWAPQPHPAPPTAPGSAAPGPGWGPPPGAEHERTVRRAGVGTPGPAGVGSTPATDPDPASGHTPRLLDDPLVATPRAPGDGGGSSSTRPGARPTWLVPALAAAVVALAVVAVAVVLTRPSSAPPTPAAPSRTVSTPTDDSAIGDGVFTAPAIAATAEAGRVTFTWTYDAPEPGDSFRLYVGVNADAARKATPMTSKAPRYRTVEHKPGTMRCALVQVVRGGQLSPASDVVCERTL